MLGLAGESGSGKSTTGRLLLRLLDPTAGKIIYGGENLADRHQGDAKFRAKMQVVFQDPNSSLSPRMRVGEAIGHPP